MEEIPDELAARQAWLERWAEAQAAETAGSSQANRGLGERLGKLVESQLDRLDPILDLRLNTARNTSAPDGIDYVAGPSPWHIVPRALRRVGADEDDVFMDLGCGTGRVVHQAAKRRLKRVIGVEMIPAVADRARTLVKTHRSRYRCRSVEIVTCDVTRFRVPDDVTIAYLGQVQGFSRKVLDGALHNLIESIGRNPRRLRLVYYRARYGDARFAGMFPATPVVEATGHFRLVPEVSFRNTAIFDSYT